MVRKEVQRGQSKDKVGRAGECVCVCEEMKEMKLGRHAILVLGSPATQ